MNKAIHGIVVLSMLALVSAGMILLAGCGSATLSTSTAQNEVQPTTISSSIPPPTSPTASDRANAILKPTTPTAGDAIFTAMQFESSVLSSLEDTNSGIPHIIVTIPDPAVSGGTRSVPLVLSQAANGNISVNQAGQLVIFPEGDCTLEFSPTTHVIFRDPGEQAMSRVQPVSALTPLDLVGYTTYFSVNPLSSKHIPNWTLPTSMTVKLTRLKNGDYALKGSSLTLYWNGITSVKPSSGTFKAITGLYDSAGHLKNTRKKIGTIDSKGYGYITPGTTGIDDQTVFNGISVTLDFRNGPMIL